jgi:CubicO group peptidase (beta-lactamase class C family)
MCWNRLKPLLNKALFIGPLFMLLFNSRSHPAQPAVFDTGAIDEFITKEMTGQRIPGLALAITRGDKVLYVKGYGVDGNGQSVTPRTQFFIASLSKSFTALAVMQLVEAGKLGLDTPVQTYLPEFTLSDPGVASQITVRHLLNQVSGLSELGFADMSLPQPETIKERVTSLRAARPVAKPGTEYHYFSPNYGTLACLVEVVSGQPFSEYMDRQVFTPLGMSDSLSVVTSTEGILKADHLAKGHLVAFGIPFSYPETHGYLGGSGGVITTAEDIARYLILQNNAGRYLEQKLVTPDSMSLMHTPPKRNNSTYAMGWTENTFGDRRVLEHTGIISTYSAEAILIPEDGIGISFLYNVSSFATTTFGAPQIRSGLISLLTGQQTESSWMTVRLWGWMVGILTLIGGFLAIRSLLLLPRWIQMSEVMPWWQLVPGIVWAFVPAVALLGMPWLTARFADRVFGFVNFYKSMLEIFVWLGLTGILGVVNGTARIVILLRRLMG